MSSPKSRRRGGRVRGTQVKGVALTVENVTRAVDQVEGWTTVARELNVPVEKQHEIREKYSSPAECKRAAVEWWMQNNPTASWRRLITSLEHMGEDKVADVVRSNTEPVADPTLTLHNVVSAVESVDDWESLANCLYVPDFRLDQIRERYSSKAQQREAMMEYWLHNCETASWRRLAGSLYLCEEERALQAVREYIHSPPDSTLTLNSLKTGLRGVRDWDSLGYCLDVPPSKRDELQAECGDDHDKCLEALLDHWLKTHPAPSWRRVAEALYDIEEHTVLREIQGKYDTGKEQARRHFDEAMKHGHIKSRMAKVLVSGVAGSGKTCFTFVVVDEPPPQIRRSTPCAKRPVRVARIDIRNWKWRRLHAQHMMGYVASAARARLRMKLAKRRASSASSNQKKPEAPASPVASTSSAQRPSPDQPTSPLASTELQSGEKASEAADAQQAAADSSVTEDELLRLIEQSTGEEITELNCVQFIDSGGQPQFHEILPVFLRRTSACIFVMKLCEKLDQHPTIEYYDDNGKLLGKSFLSVHTNEQILKHCIRTMQSQGREGKCPKIIIIGTHKDHEGECPESREAKNQKLAELLLPTFQNEVVYHGKDLIFPLNTQCPGEEERRIAEELRRLIMTECSLPADNIPLGWYALELKLSELAESLDRDVLYKNECFAAAQKLHFEVDSFEAALKYLDELNIIFYYPSILPGVVFASIQVLLDKASELVEFIFQLSERRERQELCTGEQKRFADHGLVSVAFLQQFDRHYVPGLFTPEDLVKLFRALLILADFRSPEYFMPCLLQTLTFEEVSKHRDSSSSPVVPLVLHFPDGVRNGLFCSLIAFLLSPENCFPAPWKILLRQGTSTPVCLNRNCVVFTIPRRPGIVRAIDSFAFFEVHTTVPARFCDHICNAVFTGLKKAASTLGYNNSQPEPAIICPCQEGDLHPAVVLPKEDVWICTCDSQVYSEKLTEDQLFWQNLKATSPAAPGDQISPSPHPPQGHDTQSIPGTSSGDTQTATSTSGTSSADQLGRAVPAGDSCHGDEGDVAHQYGLRHRDTGKLSAVLPQTHTADALSADKRKQLSIGVKTGGAIILFLILVIGALMRRVILTPSSFSPATVSDHDTHCHPVESKQDLYQAVAEIGNWQILCSNLGVEEATMSMLQASTEPLENKKLHCLNAFVDQRRACWEDVVRVIVQYPFYKRRLAELIARKHGIECSVWEEEKDFV